MGWPVLGGLQSVIAPGQANHYASFPYCLRTAAGNRLVTYRDWDGTNPADHGTGGASWLIRNEGSPVLLWSAGGVNGSRATPNGQTLEDDYIIQAPGAGAIVQLIRTDGGGTIFYYSTSTDEGVTWSNLAALPAFTGMPAGWTSSAFFDFLPSADGTKVYATLWGVEPGVGQAESVALVSSTDGIHWSFRSLIFSAVAGAAANEATAVRMPDGRLVAVGRNSSASPVLNGFTAISDDDGATWTTPVQQANAIWQAPRGFALSADVLCIICRDADPSHMNGYGTAFWVIGRDGTSRTRGIHFWRIGSNGGGSYCHWLKEGDGNTYLYTYQDFNTQNPPGVVKSLLTFRP